MATTRLRKTFKYPDDADSDSTPEELDEQGMSLRPSITRHIC